MWKTWKIGQQVTYKVTDFDGKTVLVGTVTEINEDHAIVSAEGMNLWVDEDTVDMFN